MLKYSPTRDLLKHKVVLITGASSGIGQAVAIACAKYGATVILLARSINKLEQTYDRIIQAGYSKPLICPFNLCTATPEDFHQLKLTIDQKFGLLDGLVHNAGLLPTLSPIEHHDIFNWYKVLQVNLNSSFILSKLMFDLLRRANSASVIFTCPKVAKQPKANWGAYSVAGAGAQALMQIMADECEQHTKIRSNSIIPNAVATKLRAQAYPAEEQDSLINPNDENIVNAYLYLLGKDSENVNNTSLHITCS